MSQTALIVGFPVVGRALEIGHVLLGGGDGLCLVFDQDVYNAVRNLERHRPNLFWRVYADAAALNHGGPTHAYCRSFGRDDHVATGEKHRVTCEAASVGYPNQRHEAAELGPVRKGLGVHSDAALAVRISGAAASTFHECDHRDLMPMR